jgi:hypothetical protein
MEMTTIKELIERKLRIIDVGIRQSGNYATTKIDHELRGIIMALDAMGIKITITTMDYMDKSSKSTYTIELK